MKKKKESKLNRVTPVTRKQFIDMVDKMMEVIDGLIDNDKYHSSMEMSMINEMEKLKSQIANKEVNKEDKNGIEVA